MDLPSNKTIENAIKLLGEAIMPGASLLMDGKIVSGSIHLIVGAWARVVFGPVGAALVGANSFSESTTGKSILQHFLKVANDLWSSNASVLFQPTRTVGVRV